MKNFAKMLLPILAFAHSSLAADGVTIKPNGKFDFAAGILDNRGYNSKELVSVNKNRFGFLSQAKFVLNIKNQLENNISYGAQISLGTSTRSDRSTPSHLFFESDGGKLEFGSDKSVMTKMKITGWSNASATAGSWDAWARHDIRGNNIQYVTNPSNFLDTKVRHVKQLEYSRKISYYTPKLAGFQLGISYIPDTLNMGGTPLKDDAPDYHINKVVSGYGFDMKDGIALGLTKEHMFSDKLSAKLSLVGESAKVAVKIPSAADTAAAIKAGNPLVSPVGVKFKKLRTYNIGAEVKYGQFAISGCYADFRKSLTANNVLIDPADRKKSYLYNVGAKYSFEKLSISATYFHSNNKKNTIDSFTIGTDYKLAPGIMPYAEVTTFNAKGWYKKLNNDTTYISDNHHGIVALVGMKLEF